MQHSPESHVRSVSWSRRPHHLWNTKSQSTSRTKEIINKTSIRPIVMHRAECWTLSQKDKQNLDVIQKKVSTEEDLWPSTGLRHLEKQI
jgi:hypothetical protein